MTKRSLNRASALTAIESATSDLEPRFKGYWSKAVKGWLEDGKMSQSLVDLASGKMSPTQFLGDLSSMYSTVPRSLIEGVSAVHLRGYNMVRADIGEDAVEALNEWSRRSAITRAKNLTIASSQSVASIVADGIREELSVKDIAAGVKKVVGVDPRFAKAAMNQRRAKIANGVKSGAATKDMLTYLDRAASHRATVIARTEVIAALNEGRRRSLIEARANGLLAAGTEMVWIAAPGCCTRCTAINGKKVGIGGVFVLGHEFIEHPPLHPNCRCTIGVA